MKNKHLVGMILVAALLAGCASEENHKEAKQARLMAKAKVSQADAQSTALAQVPNGTVKESELEKEHGKLIWSFDIATPGAKEITEVNVDAIDGTIVSKEIENEKDEKD
ncbi:MAG TPA: PepSY domain-containing protein [Verrucomicrobiae bacterium]|nr:PepSY domain-containing protein [Verrucomicrobiae bacterium]